MPTAAARARSAQLPLTARELQIMALSWQCMTEQPKIDFDKLAPLANSTKNSCKDAWRGIKDKLAYMAENPPATGLNDQKSPAIGTPGKKAKSAADVTSKPTPSKKRKISKLANDEDDEDEEEVRSKNEQSVDEDADDDA